VRDVLELVVVDRRDEITADIVFKVRYIIDVIVHWRAKQINGVLITVEFWRLWTAGNLSIALEIHAGVTDTVVDMEVNFPSTNAQVTFQDNEVGIGLANLNGARFVDAVHAESIVVTNGLKRAGWRFVRALSLARHRHQTIAVRTVCRPGLIADREVG